MHSSRMHTARSSSHLLGGQPQCMLGYPPRCGPGNPPGSGSEDPPQCGPGAPQTPQPPPWVWAWRPPSQARPLNLSPRCGLGDSPRPDPSTSPLDVGLETPPPRGQTDMCKNVTFANFVRRR